VTGGAGGIGRGICETFVREGASVVVADMKMADAQRVAETLGKQARAVEVDVTNEAQVDAAVKATTSAFGALDVVVCNAGHQYIAAVQDVPLTEWRKMLAVHMDGTFLFTRAALRVMYPAKRGGKIIVMGSIHSREASVLKAPYVAAKHGLLGFTRAVAKEAGPHGISVNLVCPGFVRTPLVDKQIPEQAQRLGISEQEVIRNIMLVNTVDKEFTTVQDVADTCLFLAAHPTNAITGQAINVSHGWHMS
jgi:3-hydroxybutyrate dehydrogenase